MALPQLSGGRRSSGIHIKAKNRGKFTAEARRNGRSVQQEAAAVLAPGSHATALQRKRANFARNASHWNHG